MTTLQLCMLSRHYLRCSWCTRHVQTWCLLCSYLAAALSQLHSKWLQTLSPWSSLLVLAVWMHLSSPWAKTLQNLNPCTMQEQLASILHQLNARPLSESNLVLEELADAFRTSEYMLQKPIKCIQMHGGTGTGTGNHQKAIIKWCWSHKWHKWWERLDQSLAWSFSSTSFSAKACKGDKT